MQGVHGSVVRHGKSQLTATARNLGRRLHGVTRPQPKLYAIVENEQGKGRVQFYRRLVQQAAIEVGAVGGAVDVQQEVMGDGVHARSLRMSE
ncbi:hypothetical protein BFL40_05690 [Pseudomonas costantinii]|uniref:Uncharacterized protein n=1 Tax=Pseudomonas costantinii TaxID=168469 RepID=A0A1S2V650_9PSED|nr:hypothetical protein BFL40_05690 [Pseudomonas costantinii]